mgnify:CR=1 FL=1|tara:strand:+ start:7922 stop:8152 length:231 start_codon:yes stop_codon:yes gene_type:complete
MPKEDLRFNSITGFVGLYDNKGIEVDSYPVLIENDRSGGYKISYKGQVEFVPVDRVEEASLRLVRMNLESSVSDVY